MAGSLTKNVMTTAFLALDQLLDRDVVLILGGGGAMILAHGYPRGTTDVDAFPVGIDLSLLDAIVKKVAEELSLPKDWMNPYFSTFAHTLPQDYSQRLIEVFRGKHLIVRALSKEEMLIMKCFARRQKDIAHAKALMLAGVKFDIVEKQIQVLLEKRIPGAKEALDFLDDVRDQVLI